MIFALRPLTAPLIAAALALTLGACASGPPKSALEVIGKVPDGSTAVPILVATTRERAKEPPGLMFSGDRSRELNYADVTISIPPSHKTGELEIGSDARKSIAVVSRDYIDKKQFITTIRKELAKRKLADRDVLVFIHGYNTRFDEAVFRFAQIVHDAKYQGVAVLFTWPSRGELLAYPYDRESAIYSRDDLEAILTLLARESGAQQIDLLAHSMGNMLTMEVLRQAKIRGNPTFGGKLGYVMLAAPDVDIDVFRRQILTFGRFPKPVTIFVSKDDKALNISKFVWQSEDRAGSFQVTDPAMMAKLASLNVSVIDLSDVKTSDSLNHAKFAASPDIVQMIGMRLATDPMQARGASFGDKMGMFAGAVGRTVGTAAGLAVELPLDVVGGVAEGVSNVGSDNRPR